MRLLLVRRDANAMNGWIGGCYEFLTFLSSHFSLPVSWPSTPCVSLAFEREQTDESVPELLVDAAVDDEVDGGVEDEEDVVSRVQVVDVGRCVETPSGAFKYSMISATVKTLVKGVLAIL